MSGVKVLVAEDDRLNRMMMCKLLSKYGAECVTAEDGRIAIEKCLGEHFDIVMLDYNMPGYSGSECAAIIREKMPENRPMIVGVSADEEHQSNEVFDDFMAKPFRIEKIQELLKKVSKEEDDRKV